jgi:phosphate transport system substrate-binding protein
VTTPRPIARLLRLAHALVVSLAVAGLVVIAVVAGAAAPAGAASYTPVSGEGSSWSAGALDQWIADVHADGIQINYTANGSTAGREDFIQGQTDFAASDIPFQTDPGDGSAPENPKAGSYAYMPITSGGTVFMYNLTINGQRVTNLRLSPANIFKIFTGVITNWDDPALAADNPGLHLPDQSIVPVVRSDGSGTSYELSAWMINQDPSLWSAYCAKAGRPSNACGATSFYPTTGNMIAQNGDLGVASYVSQAFASGSIGYVNYYYALTTHFPVAQVLNAAGYYTEPTPQNVAVSLLQDQVDTTDTNNPALYLTQKLQGVYTDPDPRTYPFSSYGYLILPTTTSGNGFSTAKGATLAAFAYYAMCQGQQQSAALGYSPMPINLVQAAFAQIAKIPGADVQNINIQSCNNPTFTPSGQNLLALTAPYPPACDKQGPTQCTYGTGGAATVSTPDSGSPGAAAGSSSAAKAGAGSAGSSGTAAGKGGAGSAGSSTGSTVVCDPTTGACTTTSGSGDSADGSASPTALTDTLAAGTGWSTTQTLLLLIGLAVLALMLVPGLVSRYLERRRSSP